MIVLKNAVGAGVHNPDKNEVSLVQRLLNKHRPPHLRPIATDGLVGRETVTAIEEFQRRVMKMANPDGRVDPGMGTFRALCGGSVAEFEAYRVRPGDTLASIARGRGQRCSAADLEQANGLFGRYNLVVGQCLAVPKSGDGLMPPPVSTATPATPANQKDQSAKNPGHPEVYFPTSGKPLPELAKYIGFGVEHKFDKRVILKGRVPGLAGNTVEWEVSYAGVVRVGRNGTVGTFWQTTDEVTKYRTDIVRFGTDVVSTLYSGMDLGIKKVASDGKGGHTVTAAIVLGAQIQDVSLEGKVQGNPQTGYTVSLSTKIDRQVVKLADGTEVTFRGELQIEIKLGRDMNWVLTTYPVWQPVKTRVVGWVQQAADTLAQIDWEKTATVGALSVTAVGLGVYSWARFVMAAKTFAEGVGLILRTAAGATTGVLFIILPQAYWEQQSRLPGQSMPGPT